jgi:acetyl-CoA carboxylase biotin carboxylase subunit
MITGFDLVKMQIQVAQGEKLNLVQSEIPIRGHAIEFRINAEDWKKDFMPCPGLINLYLPPGGPGVRVDSHMYPGYRIPANYDSLLAKLIVWGPTRTEAIARAKRALHEFVIGGVTTIIPFHEMVLDHPQFIAGDIQTDFIQKHLLAPVTTHG